MFKMGNSSPNSKHWSRGPSGPTVWLIAAQSQSQSQFEGYLLDTMALASSQQ